MENVTPTVTDWLMVIITGVYVIATICICIANFMAANASKKQKEEMEREFQSVNRPIITVELVFLRRAVWAIRCKNQGNQTAFNMSIKLQQDFIESITDSFFRGILEENQNAIRTIGVGQTYDLFIGDNSFMHQGNKIPIKGKILYGSCYSAIFSEDFVIETKNYGTEYSLSTENEDLIKAIKEQTQMLAAIKRELEKKGTPSDV